MQLLRCHAVPGAFFLLLYFTDIRGMELGGGPILPPQDVLGSLLAHGLGLPFTYGNAWIAWPVLLLSLVVTLFGLWLLRRAGDDEWVFFGMAIIGAPLVLMGKALFGSLLGQAPLFLYERYFFIPFAFFLLLLSHVLAVLARRSIAGRLLVAVVLLIVCAGNIWRVVEFSQAGRGSFRDVLVYVDRETPASEPEMVVAGDHDFRVSKFVAFYGRYAGGQRPFVYQKSEDVTPEGDPWLLLHRPDGGEPPDATLTDRHGNEYQQAAVFRAAQFGGWDWYVYRK